MLELVRLVLATLVAAARNRQGLVVGNLLLRQQLQVALGSRRHSRLRSRDKLFWLLVRRLNRNWRRHLFLVRPETVLRWHRQGWRLFWRWRSSRSLGRPRLKPEVRTLIATMARETSVGHRAYRRWAYYNQDRPHRSLGLETPVMRRRPVDGEVVSRPVLGGLHHVFERAA
jgi:hypothetical protein